MKKLFALALVCALCLGSAALAAEWGEGLSPAKPYQGVPEVNLNEKFGYFVVYPSQKKDGRMYAHYFCDVLEVYMPDEGVEIGSGTVTLWDADSQPVCVLDVTDPAQAELRPMEEDEMNWMMWGSGVCLELFLPVSLEMNKEYYVTYEEGILTTNHGNVKCQHIPYDSTRPAIEQYWSPMLAGDFGISGLYYSAPAEEEPAEDGEEAEATAEATAGPKYKPAKGDLVNFDIVLGGDAAAAVVYSENNSVFFEIPEYTESSHVTGTVIGDDVTWGVVFVDADNNPVVIDPNTEERAVFTMSPLERTAGETEIE